MAKMLIPAKREEPVSEPAVDPVIEAAATDTPLEEEPAAEPVADTPEAVAEEEKAAE